MKSPILIDPRGPALQSRPSHIALIEGKARGSVATDRITVLRYGDTTLYDRMHVACQISDRQHQAADRLGRMWTAAGLNQQVCASMELMRSDEVEPFDAPEETSQADPDEPTARDRYRRLMRHAGTAYSLRVEAMLTGDHPGIRWLATLQAALDYFADEFGLEKSS